MRHKIDIGFQVNITYTKILSLTLFVTFFSINHLVFNPVYLISLLLILIYIIAVIKKPNIYFYEFWALILCIIISITQFLAVKSTLNLYNEANFLSPLLFIYCLILSAITYRFSSSTSQATRLSVYGKTIIPLITFLTIETSTRIIFLKGTGEGIYAFKKSFFYFDSNFTGLVVLSFLFFYYYLELRTQFNFSKYYKIILWLLLILTFSRSSILVGVILYFFLLKTGRLRFIAIIISASLAAYQLVSMINFYMSGGSFVNIDGSFNSKFYIIEKFIDTYTQLPFNDKLIGVGMGNSELYLGIFAHNIIVTFMLELGIIGSLIVILWFYYTLAKSKYHTSFIILPITFAGMSLFSAYSPFLFVLSTLIVVEERSKYRLIKNSKS